MNKSDREKLRELSGEPRQFDNRTVRALLDLVDELEGKVDSLSDKHWVEETETLRLDSPAGREFQRMKDEHMEATATLAAMNSYLNRAKNVTGIHEEAGRLRLQLDHQRKRAEAWKVATLVNEAARDPDSALTYSEWEEASHSADEALEAARQLDQAAPQKSAEPEPHWCPTCGTCKCDQEGEK